MLPEQKCHFTNTKWHCNNAQDLLFTAVPLFHGIKLCEVSLYYCLGCCGQHWIFKSEISVPNKTWGVSLERTGFIGTSWTDGGSCGPQWLWQINLYPAATAILWTLTGDCGMYPSSLLGCEAGVRLSRLVQHPKQPHTTFHSTSKSKAHETHLSAHRWV